MHKKKKFLLRFLLALAVATTLLSTGCGVYSFSDASVPEGVRTIRVNFLENRARYVNPQLSPQLTERLRQKIVNQTRLTQTSSDNVDWDVTGYISDYSISTSAISSNQPGGAGGQRQAAVTNRLTVSVQLTVNDRQKNTSQDVSVSRSFEFDANLTLQAAESRLLDEILRNMTDDIFNRMFSNW
jgi:outer membrane lipopolysaccharide assembly protein LptE/RlpB